MKANAQSRVDGPLAVWRDLIAEPIWKYEELPPFQLSELTKIDLLEASDSELARAIWFWLRRPKLMFPHSEVLMMVGLCLLISLSIALVNWHFTSAPKRIAEMIIVLFEVVVEIYAIGHRLKFLRWRREYERSIDRLIRTHHPGM